MLGAMVKKAGNLVKNKVKQKVAGGAIGQGVKAFRSYQAGKKPAAPKPTSGLPGRVGEFKTGIDTNLKVPKISSFQRQPLY